VLDILSIKISLLARSSAVGKASEDKTFTSKPVSEPGV
jgi:hypothetical protein